MIIVISGKAGSGKTTLRTELLRSCDVEKAISFTTRSPRKTEQNGKDYYFVSRDFFEKQKDIILKREDNGFLYGVDKKSFLDKNVITILDVNGIQELSHCYNPEDIHIIFLDVPKRILIERLQERGTSLPDIYQRFKKDNNLSYQELKKRFPLIHIINIDNSCNFAETVQKSKMFINSIPRKVLYNPRFLPYASSKSNEMQ